jgi:predicted NBD/HSP70 family sugar kinase/biotin operon repressor
MPTRPKRETASTTQRAALTALVRRPGLTRAELAEELGLTRQAVTQLAEKLERQGLISMSDRPSGAGGQPARVYRYVGQAEAVAIGLDIAHQHTRVALFDASGQRVGDEHLTRAHGLRRGDAGYQPARVFDWAHDRIEALLAENGRDPERDVIGVGIGISGPVSQEDHMLRAGPRPAAWEALDFAKEVRERFPRYDTWAYEVDNDATLGALAEHRTGAATGCDNVVYVRWTYGIGSGLVLDGKLFRGTRGVAGEFGHVVFRKDDHDDIAFELQPCEWCEQVCVQELAGTATIVTDALARGADLPPDADIGHVIARAREGDGHAQNALQRAARYIGRSLAIVIDLLNPQLVVLGGAFGRDAYPLVVPTIQSAMREQAIQPAFRDVRIVMGHHGGLAGGAVARGAAALVFERHIGTWAFRALAA